MFKIIIGIKEYTDDEFLYIKYEEIVVKDIRELAEKFAELTERGMKFINEIRRCPK